VEVSAVPIDYRGQPGALVFVRDMTERQRAEQALRESERRLSVLMANLPGMAYRCRNLPGWPMQFVSEGCLDLTGYTAQELTGNTLFYGELILPEDRALVEEAVREGLRQGSAFQMSYRIRRRDGSVRYVWEQGRLASPPDEPDQWLEGLVTDVTEQHAAREEITRQLDELRRWQAVMLAREDRILELKRQVNALHVRLGEPPPYPSVAGDGAERARDGQRG